MRVLFWLRTPSPLLGILPALAKKVLNAKTKILTDSGYCPQPEHALENGRMEGLSDVNIRVEYVWRRLYIVAFRGLEEQPRDWRAAERGLKSVFAS